MRVGVLNACLYFDLRLLDALNSSYAMAAFIPRATLQSCLGLAQMVQRLLHVRLSFGAGTWSLPLSGPHLIGSRLGGRILGLQSGDETHRDNHYRSH